MNNTEHKIGQLRDDHMINEMARVGFMDNMDVVIYTDDPGYIPHVHVIDLGTRGYDFDACVMLEDNRYFTHGKHTDVFNSKQRKCFNDFMHEPCRLPQFRNNYELAVSMWNLNNSDSYVIPKTNREGETIIPNYTTIKPYKDAVENTTEIEQPVQPKKITIDENSLKKYVEKYVTQILNEKLKK